MKALEQELEVEVPAPALTANEGPSPIASKISGPESQPSVIHRLIKIAATDRRVKIALLVILNAIAIYLLQFHLFRSGPLDYLP